MNGISGYVCAHIHEGRAYMRNHSANASLIVPDEGYAVGACYELRGPFVFHEVMKPTAWMPKRGPEEAEETFVASVGWVPSWTIVNTKPFERLDQGWEEIGGRP